VKRVPHGLLWKLVQAYLRKLFNPVLETSLSLLMPMQGKLHNDLSFSEQEKPAGRFRPVHYNPFICRRQMLCFAFSFQPAG